MKISIRIAMPPTKIKMYIGRAFAGPETEPPEPEPESKADPETPAEERTPQKTVPRKPRKPAATQESWWDKMSSDEQDEYLERHPRSRRLKTRTKGVVKTLVSLKLNEVHSKARALGKDYRFGMKGLRSMRAGKPVSPAQKQGMKRTATLVGSLLLVALVGAALFTPLGGLAMDMGSDYLEYLKSQAEEQKAPETESSPVVGDTTGDEESRSSSQDLDRDTLDEFQKGMAEWFTAQDPQAVVDRYKKKQGI